MEILKTIFDPFFNGIQVGSLAKKANEIIQSVADVKIRLNLYAAADYENEAGNLIFSETFSAELFSTLVPLIANKCILKKGEYTAI